MSAWLIFNARFIGATGRPFFILLHCIWYVNYVVVLLINNSGEELKVPRLVTKCFHLRCKRCNEIFCVQMPQPLWKWKVVDCLAADAVMSRVCLSPGAITPPDAWRAALVIQLHRNWLLQNFLQFIKFCIFFPKSTTDSTRVLNLGKNITQTQH